MTEKLAALREALKDQGVDGFFLSHRDPYCSEFLSPEFARIEWLTGFTGSASRAVILPEKAVVFSDGRYALQMKEELDPKLYEIRVGMSPEEVLGWLDANVSAGMVIGYDPWIALVGSLDYISGRAGKGRIDFVAMENNPIDLIWRDRPPAEHTQVCLFPDAIAGSSAADKIQILKDGMRPAKSEQEQEQGQESGQELEQPQAALICKPDSIAWLLNIRAQDTPCVPVALSYLLLRRDGPADWFIAPERVPQPVKKMLGENVRLVPPAEMDKTLHELDCRKGPVLLDPARSVLAFRTILDGAGISVREAQDPCIEPRAVKTKAELAAFRQAHVLDGLALARAFCWLDREAEKGGLSEAAVADKIEACRALSPAYRGPSFPSIVGFGANGAIVHYRHKGEGARIVPPGLLLIDSGGQYLGPDQAAAGTTDLTRTIAVGSPDQEMKTQFTRVLKGHIAIARAVFPEGTDGAQIDVLARGPLWAAGQDYAHGTGHGVGVYLSVHEDSAGISPRSHMPFRPGMVVTNEPGYYREGQFGIRIENIVTVREGGHCPDTNRAMLFFETVSLVPVDRRLIMQEMLGAGEKDWLNRYHAQVHDSLAPLLNPGDPQDAQVAQWLKEVTAPL